MKLNSKHIYIRPLTQEDARDLLSLQLENREFFKNFSYERPEAFYTLETQQNRIIQFQTDSQNDEAYQFGIFANDGSLLGTINLFQVMRGSLQSAFIGYFLDKKHNGKGYTTEAVKLLTKYAFEELDLHRLEAGVMPHNIGSIRVLEKAGFHKEGLAVSNVRINGEWKDHQVLAIINPKHISPQGDIQSPQKTVELVPVDRDNRLQYLDYLLLADESEAIVQEYIHEGEMFAVQSKGETVGVALFTFHSNRVVKLKNMALSPNYRGTGIGKQVVSNAFQFYKQKDFRKMIVGTANSSIANIAFYQKAGFRISEIKKDFFLHYPNPIYENGIRATDMVVFERNLGD